MPLSARNQENKHSSLEDFGADQGSKMRGPSYSAPYTRLNLNYSHDTSNRPCLWMCARSSNQSCSKMSFRTTIGTYLRSAHEQKLPTTSTTSVLLQTKQQKSQLIPPSQSPVTGESWGNGSPQFSSKKIKWNQSSVGLKSKNNCSNLTYKSQESMVTEQEMLVGFP